jgi:hypothetical protein
MRATSAGSKTGAGHDAGIRAVKQFSSAPGLHAQRHTMRANTRPVADVSWQSWKSQFAIERAKPRDLGADRRRDVE